MPATLDPSLLSIEGLRPDAGDNSKADIARALRRIRPELEKLLAGNKVPPMEAYEFLLVALRTMPDDLEGAQLDRRLVQEVRKSLSTRRERDKLRMEQGKAWINLLVQAGIVSKADRVTWLRTIRAHQQ